jgi:hypothetical protein
MIIPSNICLIVGVVQARRDALFPVVRQLARTPLERQWLYCLRGKERVFCQDRAARIDPVRRCGI